MIIGSPHPDWLSFFNTTFRKCAHQLFIWGYQDSRSRIGPNDQEDDITCFIAEAIENRLNDPGTPREYQEHYDIKEQKPVHSAKRTGKNRQRIDIVAVCNSTQPRPEFWFEAKRLKTVVFPISKYTGYDGMQCYLRCEYAAGCPAAAMVGYMQNSTPTHWHQELKRVMGSAGNLRVMSNLQHIQILSSVPNEWVSVHIRDDNTAISIFHILLDCT
ncbi:MAG TPA: hypothetical protein VFJ58_22140 [Armatimonadota bacterium]|nr:hypothetical protein [Armatimonadota bacterium]